MRVRSVAPLALAAIVAAGSLAPAAAAPKKKKPLKKTYSLNLTPMPDASEVTACSGAARMDGNMDVEAIKVTGAGILTVKVTEFIGDWDMSVYSAAGSMLSEGAGTTTPVTSADPQTETMKYKSKKAQTLNLRVCNFLGGPTATVTYTYTYN